MSKTPPYAFSAASGCVWAGIALFLGYGPIGPLIWGGVLVSPLIGLFVGWAAGKFRIMSKWAAIFIPLVGLYVAVSLFGLGIGIFDLVTGNLRNRILSEVLFTPVLVVLWGVTFTGYVMLLWPLAYWNHVLLWRRVYEEI